MEMQSVQLGYECKRKQIVIGGFVAQHIPFVQALKLTTPYRFTSIAFGCLAMVAALCLPSTRKFETNRIAVDLS